MNAVIKEKTVELFAFIIAAVLQLLRVAYEYAPKAASQPLRIFLNHYRNSLVIHSIRYVIFANTESVSSLMLGDIIVNVSIHTPNFTTAKRSHSCSTGGICPHLHTPSIFR